MIFFVLGLVLLGGLALVALLVGKVVSSKTKDSGAFVSELWIYPVKSCKGIRVKTSQITRLGLTWDRRFMVAESKTNLFVSQRKYPKMANIEPSVSQDDDGTVTLKLTYNKGGHGAQSHVEKFKVDDAKTKFPKEQVKVWGDTMSAARLSDKAAKWLTSILSLDCYLVTVISESEHSRPAPKEYRVSSSDQAGGFPDGFPYLLASEESLALVNAKLKQDKAPQIPMDRFRPNIVVKGVSEPFAEDYWAKIRIGDDIHFRVAKPCSRCSMPTVDQKTGTRNKDNQPTRSMRKFRLFRWVKSSKADVYFGQNLISYQTTQTGLSLSEGAPVSVVCGTWSKGGQASKLTSIMLHLAKFL
uniref:MOSC domain-containing protein n=1 Tax=Lotharella globosa TaxID=91324 RepID=A0A6V3P1P3_9EUKA|mmetsp:Transcript_12845/g.24319  ORF Transcript_12845/g.24319 Transcript_12845/m.24319 type:complete len:356 (+) Transcript_12845:69-1136(+)|eukprot:CAMPEP_0167790928 /NCGR_PEP_ID=MMETSP0111_2-20121227/11613_1 /TAXON_ID=91324 /ORGANISM="Lotharella globosa, Strain CCCM811" /LENGTH=355 /DNA_ID=CAMNT_0007683461 /DNA_START=75 /DNA_END=1142 /DNA_ORIENTATION=-